MRGERGVGCAHTEGRLSTAKKTTAVMAAPDMEEWRFAGIRED